MGPNRLFWRDQRVCVTGGTGFLGFVIVRQLEALGAHVRVLALPPAQTHPILRLGSVEKHFGDVRDTARVRKAVQNCDVVFHAAGAFAASRQAAPWISEVHLRGTENVLAVSRPDARILHTSSVAAVGASSGRPLTEGSDWNLQRLRVDYVQAKRSTEEQALAAAEHGRDVVVLNPGALIGPEDYGPSHLGRFCLRFWKGQMLLLPPGGLNVVDVRDAAIGHLLAAERGRAGRRYILGGENVSFAALLRLLGSAAGMRPRAVARIPRWMWWLLAAGAESRATLRKREPLLSFQLARLQRFVWFYDSTKACAELGYRPRPLSESLGDTFDWHNARRPIRLHGFSRFWMRPVSPGRATIIS